MPEVLSCIAVNSGRPSRNLTVEQICVVLGGGPPCLKKEGATTESPVDGQDQPRIYTRDHTLEVLMHPDVLELHAVRVIHTLQGDE